MSLLHRLLFVAALLAIPTASAQAQSPERLAEAQALFAEAQVLCERDGGALWGRSLCGPILLVDWRDRSAIGSQADEGSVLTAAGEVFAGTLPQTVIIANTSTDWSGVRWTQLVWPLPETEANRRVLIGHELFHRIQRDLGLTRSDNGNAHLDTLEGRYLLQLEWRALAAAMSAPDRAAQAAAVRDALLFRRERYRLFPAAEVEEGSLEIQEGVPEYTGVRVGLDRPEARRAFAIHDLQAFVQAPTFVRSFAYATGPAYGLLLDEVDPQWCTKVEASPGLHQMLIAALGHPAPDFAALASRTAAYDDGTLRAFEERRDRERQARLADYRARLVDGPRLIFALANANRQFNPQTLQPLGEDGTVYPTLRLVDDWGVLEVEKDAILAHDLKSAAVSAVGIDAAGAHGAGWTLTLNPGWSIQPGQRDGDFVVTRAD